MSPRAQRILWAMITAGIIARVVVAFATVGVEYDIGSFQLVVDRLHQPHPFALYADVNAPNQAHWPYPPGYFPWLLVAHWVAHHASLPFHGVVQLLPILADGALAWIVQAYLGNRGAPERIRLAAAGLVALGPSFAFVSGYEGQLDSVGILPAGAALLVWDRAGPRRALFAGLLIGAGAATKTIPGLLLLALLPRASGRREAAALLGAVVAVPLMTILPWLVAEPRATLDALRYSGVPGIGGLSILAQPNLLDYWLLHGSAHLTALSNTLRDVSILITAAALAGVIPVLWRRRPDPATAAILVWLAVFASAVNFQPRYLVWGLPFMLMAGRLREAALMQAVGCAAAVILAARPYESDWVVVTYALLMLALLVAFVLWLVRLRSRIHTGVVREIA